jgi:UDP-N-acetylmuramate: L-alanyl-gamma-D-glutamyl-meso-diaminopimelate ligase
LWYFDGQITRMVLPQAIYFTGLENPVCAGLALHLASKGHKVSGSDRALDAQKKQQLQAVGVHLYPQWEPKKHRADLLITGPAPVANPNELQLAHSAGVPVQYYPEVIYQLLQHQQRIVVTGSRGRTNLVALLIHALTYHKRPLSYVVEGHIPWLSQPVQLGEGPVAIIEGTDWPAPEGNSAGFLYYQHHIGVITHISAENFAPFSSEEEYVAQYDRFADNTPKAGILLYNESNTLVSVIGAKQRTDVTPVPYAIHPHTSENGQHFALDGSERIPIKVFGTQNFESISAAKELLKRIGMPPKQFYQALQHFTF